MIIQISDDWRIVSDAQQWVVQHLPGGEGGGKRKEDTWKPLAYFRDLGGAVVYVGRRRILDLPGHYHREALEPLCRALDALEGDIRAAVAGIRPEEMPDPMSMPTP